MGWLPFKDEFRELMYRNGLAEGWLGYKLAAVKTISPNGLAMGWLPFIDKLRKLMLEMGWLSAGWVKNQRQ